MLVQAVTPLMCASPDLQLPCAHLGLLPACSLTGCDYVFTRRLSEVPKVVGQLVSPMHPSQGCFSLFNSSHSLLATGVLQTPQTLLLI